jgi:hypothetical protein
MTPIARKPVGYYEPTTKISPKPSSLSKLLLILPLAYPLLNGNKGDVVNLNQIFTLLHYVIPDEERTGHLGDMKIISGISESVITASEWSSTWRRASRATRFAFSHQKKELLEYGDYIESEFSAKLTLSHHKLILYDIALQNNVTGGQHSHLTNHHRFTRLYLAIVLPDGVETYSKQTINKKPNLHQASSKPKICNKFNL